jgi:hypothetical protein
MQHFSMTLMSWTGSAMHGSSCHARSWHAQSYPETTHQIWKSGLKWVSLRGNIQSCTNNL